MHLKLVSTLLASAYSSSLSGVNIKKNSQQALIKEDASRLHDSEFLIQLTLDMSTVINIGKIDKEALVSPELLTREYIFKNYTKRIAGLGGSVGCAVRLETRRSRVQPPPRSATYFRGD